MSQDEIIEMLKISGLGKILMLDEYAVIRSEPIKSFAQLVANKQLVKDYQICLQVKYDPAYQVRETFAAAIKNQYEKTL